MVCIRMRTLEPIDFGLFVPICILPGGFFWSLSILMHAHLGLIYARALVQVELTNNVAS